MIRLMRAFGLAVALLLVGSAALAQEGQPSPEEAAMMAAWQTYMTPGEPHQHLATAAGEWRHELTMWMAPDAPPTETTATSTAQPILGGRYVVEEYAGDMMGMPFEGRGTYGYDNAKEQYFMTWIDNMGTGLMVGWGAPEGNKVTYTGTYMDPMTGEEAPFRSIVTHVDDNHMIMEMYMPAPGGGGEFKSMEIHSYRKTS